MIIRKACFGVKYKIERISSMGMTQQISNTYLQSNCLVL